MHTVDQLEQALAVARLLGYGVRQEWLGGAGGGGCVLAGRKWMFLDLALSTAEQLDEVIEALRADADLYGIQLSPEMSRLLGVRRSA